MMSKKVAEYTPSSVEISPGHHSSINSSFNTVFISGSSNNNTYNVINNYANGQPNDDSPPTIEVQEDLKEVLPNDQRIIQLIWKYLSTVDKFNCTMVCKRFNNIISRMDCLRLIVTSPSMIQVVPLLSRDYKTVTFRDYQCKTLNPPIRQLLKHLSRSVIDLTLYHCQLDLMILCELLNELPLLESLVFMVIREMENNDTQLSMEDLPKLLHLRSLKIDLLRQKMNGFLAIFGASIIESLTLFRVKVRTTELSTFLRQQKNSLKSLTLGCEIFSNPAYSNLEFTQEAFSSFDSLLELRELYLIEINAYCILKTKCINWLTDLEVFFLCYQKQVIYSFIANYFLKKGVDELQLSEYEACKGPIVIKSKLYHVHHCSLKHSSYCHNSCVKLPLTKLDPTWINDIHLTSSLSIRVREDENEFKKIKVINYKDVNSFVRL